MPKAIGRKHGALNRRRLAAGKEHPEAMCTKQGLRGCSRLLQGGPKALKADPASRRYPRRQCISGSRDPCISARALRRRWKRLQEMPDSRRFKSQPNVSQIASCRISSAVSRILAFGHLSQSGACKDEDGFRIRLATRRASLPSRRIRFLHVSGPAATIPEGHVLFASIAASKEENLSPEGPPPVPVSASGARPSVRVCLAEGKARRRRDREDEIG